MQNARYSSCCALTHAALSSLFLPEACKCSSVFSPTTPQDPFRILSQNNEKRWRDSQGRKRETHFPSAEAGVLRACELLTVWITGAFRCLWSGMQVYPLFFSSPLFLPLPPQTFVTVWRRRQKETRNAKAAVNVSLKTHENSRERQKKDMRRWIKKKMRCPQDVWK